MKPFLLILSLTCASCATTPREQTTPPAKFAVEKDSRTKRAEPYEATMRYRPR